LPTIQPLGYCRITSMIGTLSATGTIWELGTMCPQPFWNHCETLVSTRTELGNSTDFLNLIWCPSQCGCGVIINNLFHDGKLKLKNHRCDSLYHYVCRQSFLTTWLC
jgi:hypothetical protein